MMAESCRGYSVSLAVALQTACRFSSRRRSSHASSARTPGSVAVFQPHLYSRTREMAEEFGHALSAADVVVVTDVYAAREEAVPGVDGTLITRAVSGPAEVLNVPRLDDVPAVITPDLRAGDLVLTMGAGDITTLGPRLIEALGGVHA